MRRQLTLFISDQDEVIEKIRSEFNPVQFALIAAHVTLCRENEIEKLETVISNIQSLTLDKPLSIEFNSVERFENGKGLMITGKKKNDDFQTLRKKVLSGTQEINQHYMPHITLMHPRNSTCTDVIFDHIKGLQLPAAIDFDTISLIEQTDGERWKIVRQFPVFQKQD